MESGKELTGSFFDELGFIGNVATHVILPPFHLLLFSWGGLNGLDRSNGRVGKHWDLFGHGGRRIIEQRSESFVYEGVFALTSSRNSQRRRRWSAVCFAALSSAMTTGICS
jgi:hypothetical protein